MRWDIVICICISMAHQFLNKGSREVNMREICCINGSVSVKWIKCSQHFHIISVANNWSEFVWEIWLWNSLHKWSVGIVFIVACLFLLCFLFGVALIAFFFGFVCGMVNLFCWEKSLILVDAWLFCFHLWLFLFDSWWIIQFHQFQQSLQLFEAVIENQVTLQ